MIHKGDLRIYMIHEILICGICLLMLLIFFCDLIAGRGPTLGLSESRLGEKSTIHKGNLEIWDENDAKKYADVKEVAGFLIIHSKATLNELTKVGGSLHIRSDATLNALTGVGKSLYIDGGATLTAPKLRHEAKENDRG